VKQMNRVHWLKSSLFTILMLGIYTFVANAVVFAEEDQDRYDQRMALYKKTAALTQIPWYYLAAIDQYERQILEDTNADPIISIQFPDEAWYGPGNLEKKKDVASIDFFQGIGRDGNGDGLADPDDPEDALYTIATQIMEYGPTEEDIRIGIWNVYKRDLAVHTIKNTAKVFRTFQKIHLTDRDFPVSLQHRYSYRSTWGDGRGFGGLRIHEGTDIFADYGTPVKSTTYGVVELKGWNLYGGWRIGIRDIFNIYHYYAHLSSYDKNIQVGQVVKPGDVLGSVGSSGYGPPGTSGKFPPHLHYGMYKDNGHSEWSFDPYPYLKRWERMAKDKK